jgi:hypothetical protein
MHTVPFAPLIAALSLTCVVAAGAQTPQPGLPPTGGESEPTSRLPAPEAIRATQLLNGSIHVVWNAVDGATRYHLTRSVPTVGAGTVAQPDPSDTVYVDPNVTAGKTYYYLVDAVNEAGITGLKIGAQPVTALSTTDLAPTGVTAVLNGASVTLSWKSKLPNANFFIERGILVGSSAGQFVPMARAPDCCVFTDNLAATQPGSAVIYRLTAEDLTGFRSQPTMSNAITIPSVAPIDTSNTTDTTTVPPATATTNVRPAVVAEPSKIRVGDPVLKLGRSPAFTGLALKRPHWVSLFEAVATVDAQGQVRAVAPGFTYIVVTGVAPDKSVASMVKRIDVARAR